jgi:DNA-binding transcriptional regulator/RsmH inhibitor MraZ
VEQGSLRNEFEAHIDSDGRIQVPSEMLEQFAGKKLYVHLNRRELTVGLRRNNVTEEEIERISSLQRESRGQVEEFLLSEGKLKNSAFSRRARGTRR